MSIWFNIERKQGNTEWKQEKWENTDKNIDFIELASVTEANWGPSSFGSKSKQSKKILIIIISIDSISE